MKQILVPAAFPYEVEFIKRGHRTPKGLVVWDEEVVEICEVDTSLGRLW